MASRPTLLLLLTLATPAVADEPTTWVDHVAPIFEEHCTYCHEAGEPDGGLDLTSYAGTLEGGASGEVIVPGDPGASRLFRLVSRQEEPVMPADDGEVGAEALATLRRWIEQGALETRDSKPPERRVQPSLSLEVPTRSGQEVPNGLSLEPALTSGRAPAVVSMAANPAAPVLAVAGHRQVLLYHGLSHELIGVIPFPAGRVHEVRFSRDGSLLIAAGGEGAKTGQARVWDLATGLPRFHIETKRDAYLAVDLREDARQLALGGPTREVEVHDTQSGRLAYRLDAHTDWITTLAFSPDGVLLASGDRAGNVHVWESERGKEYLDVEAHPGGVSDLAWRPDSEVLATGAGSGHVRLFRASDGRKLKEWVAHAGGVLSLTFANDGRLLSCGRDGAVRLWNAEGKEQQAWKELPDTPLSVAMSFDVAEVYAGDWTGRAHAWRGEESTSWATSPQPIEPRLAAARRLLLETGAQQGELEAAAAAAVTSMSRASAEAQRRLAEAEAAWTRLATVPEAVLAGEALVASLESAVSAARRLADTTPQDAAGRERLEALRGSLQQARDELAGASAAADAQRALDEDKAEAAATAAQEAEALAQQASASAHSRQAEAAEVARVHSVQLVGVSRWSAEVALSEAYGEALASYDSRLEALERSQLAAQAAAVASDAHAAAQARVKQAEAKAKLSTDRLEQAATLREHLIQLTEELRAAEASVAAVVSARATTLSTLQQAGDAAAIEAARADLQRAEDEGLQLLGLRVATETSVPTAEREHALGVRALESAQAALRVARDALPAAARAVAQAQAHHQATKQALTAVVAEQRSREATLTRCSLAVAELRER